MQRSAMPRIVSSPFSRLAGLGIVPLTALESASPPARPNVVLILADDLGWTDLACYGSESYETPHSIGCRTTA